MNKYIEILLGILLVLVPVIILIRQDALAQFVLFSLSITSLMAGVLLVCTGVIGLKNSIKEKEENQEENDEKHNKI